MHVQIDGIRVKRISGMHAQSQMYTEQNLRWSGLASLAQSPDNLYYMFMYMYVRMVLHVHELCRVYIALQVYCTM